MEQLKGWFGDAYGIALGWLTSPAALSQIALLIVAYVAARTLARRFGPVIERTVTPKPEAVHILARLRRFALLFLPLTPTRLDVGPQWWRHDADVWLRLFDTC